MKTISGDLIQLANKGRFDLIAHGCNCFCTMGADIATQSGERAKMGKCSFAEIGLGYSSLVLVNAYTQFDWRGHGTK